MKLTKSITTLASLTALLIIAPTASAQCCGGKSKPTEKSGGCCAGKAKTAKKAGGCCSDKSQKVLGEKKVDAKVSPDVVSHYVSLSSALYKDDLASAKKAALLIEKVDATSQIGKVASELAKSANIKSARSSYSSISKLLVPAAKGNKAYKKAHCPMANGGKGGSWLQKASDKTVNNPYFGASMAHCGSFK